MSLTQAVLYPTLNMPPRFVTALASHITDSAEIKVSVLAKAMRLAGQLGSSALPAVPGVTKEGNDTPFTVIANKGAIALAKTEA